MHVGLFFKFKQKWKYFKFIHQFYQFENEYLPEYFKNVLNFAGKSSIANAKRTTQSREELSAIYIEGTRLTFKLARSPWQQFTSLKTSEIHDICWGIMNKYPDFMDITVWIWMKLMPKLTLYFVHVCKWEEFSCFYTAVEAIFSAFVTTFEQKHRFLRVHFEAVITIF